MQQGFGAVLMAAGAGRRMGYQPKALLRRGGETLLARQIRLLVQAGVRHIVVVLGHHAAHITEELRRIAVPECVRLDWVTNPVPDAGLGGSLRLGLAVLPDAAPALMVLLVDQPLLEAEDIAALLTAWDRRANGVQLLVPQHAGEPGHPIALDAQLRREVLAGTGAEGLSAWRRAHPQQVQRLELSHARCTTDVDTLEDLQRLGERFGVWLTQPTPPRPADPAAP